jgi:hypothetical protein
VQYICSPAHNQRKRFSCGESTSAVTGPKVTSPALSVSETPTRRWRKVQGWVKPPRLVPGSTHSSLNHRRHLQHRPPPSSPSLPLCTPANTTIFSSFSLLETLVSARYAWPAPGVGNRDAVAHDGGRRFLLLSSPACSSVSPTIRTRRATSRRLVSTSRFGQLNWRERQSSSRS